MKQLILAVLFVASLSAQPTFEIRGTVSEPGLGGIAGAEITATFADVRAPSTVLTTFTDGRGQFVLRPTVPGGYRMTVRANGYAYASSMSPGAVVDAEHPHADIQFSMIRPAQATGRVLDADTREPVEGALPLVSQKTVGLDSASAFGNPLPTLPDSIPAEMQALYQHQRDETRSQADGVFTVKGLSPGEYVASIFGGGAPPMSAGYSADDLKVIDHQNEPLYWPGGVSFEDVRPIPVGSGAVVSFGDILVKKVPAYRVHLSLAQGTFPEGESMRVTLFRASAHITGTHPCGSDLLLRGLAPGFYHVYAVSDWQGERDNIENAAWATAQFEISDKNLEITLVPQRGIVLEGQLVSAEGMTELPERIGIAVQPDELAPGGLPAAEEFIDWPAPGKFRMAVSPRGLDLRAVVQTRTAYVKQLRYNGALLPDLHVQVNPGTLAHRLEIVLDDKFGMLSGEVSGGKSGQNMVVAWNEGLLRQLSFPVENGAYASGPIAPGEYRVQVVTPAAAFDSKLDPKAGQKVTIHAGETTTVHLVAR